MHALLIGNYGVGNLGDEALRRFFLDNFPGVEWTVLSADPKGENEVCRLPAGIRSFFKPWWRTISAFRHADAVVFGGGTLFTDIESVFACFLWWWHAAVAGFLSKPVYLAFQGIGPFRTSWGLRLAKRVVDKSAFISVRDKASFERVQSWNMNKKIVQTFDPVYVVFSGIKVNLTESNTIVLIPRKNSGENFLIEASKIIQEHQGDPVRIIIMQRDHEHFVVDRIRSMVHGHFEVVEAVTEEDLVQAIEDALLVVAERYHGALAALALGVPLVVCPQDIGDKLDVLQELAEKDGKKDREEFIRLIGEGYLALKAALESIKN
ncbi:hypothetical protein A3A67_03480 [Candidatus Peribacteria bacterium RIFCSPLOWO2_01_FULL_51_18]|nr:MAG: hypothetical protein A3C52_05220 [Candidatus Peribacteria bacterium RIFCSPHIGHO2_02_FULL_51_15]OGJ66519.1 MAG: hypothetical protein A3A67_03480 [Candidatus Peribacteria bacterium RIFCSPLOWO2_01_FULL_51_18]OGJ67459.1 MAG: hypothetical protein A3J34_03895 [Candidatus Peribacteria bacterium RIFCSPLOWO2_02_FULL_51_10]